MVNNKPKNALEFTRLDIRTDNVFSNFKTNKKTDLNIKRDDVLNTTRTISNTIDKRFDLLKNIDEKESQHLSRLMGVESQMKINSYNPEIMIQRLQGVSEQNYKLKTIQKNVNKESITQEVEKDEKDENELYNNFINQIDESYHQDAEDLQNIDMLTQSSSKKIMTNDVELDKQTNKTSVNDYIDNFDPFSKDTINSFKDLKKSFKRDYDNALNILLEHQEVDDIYVNDKVFSLYNDLLRKNGK